MLLYTDEDGTPVQVEGDPENPYNEGRLCVRCLALPEVTNHKDRLLYPMKRDPKDRGKNKWERMSWDEAIDYVADRFIEIRDKYGAETVSYTHLLASPKNGAAVGTPTKTMPRTWKTTWLSGSF